MISGGYFLSFFIKTICCDPSSEPSCHQDGSDEGSQHMVLDRINKNKKNHQ